MSEENETKINAETSKVQEENTRELSEEIFEEILTPYEEELSQIKEILTEHQLIPLSNNETEDCNNDLSQNAVTEETLTGEKHQSSNNETENCNNEFSQNAMTEEILGGKEHQSNNDTENRNIELTFTQTNEVYFDGTGNELTTDEIYFDTSDEISIEFGETAPKEFKFTLNVTENYCIIESYKRKLESPCIVDSYKVLENDNTFCSFLDVPIQDEEEIWWDAEPPHYNTTYSYSDSSSHENVLCLKNDKTMKNSTAKTEQNKCCLSKIEQITTTRPLNSITFEIISEEESDNDEYLMNRRRRYRSRESRNRSSAYLKTKRDSDGPVRSVTHPRFSDTGPANCPVRFRCNNQSRFYDNQSYNQTRFCDNQNRFCDRPFQPSSFNDISCVNESKFCDTRSFDQTRFCDRKGQRSSFNDFGSVNQFCDNQNRFCDRSIQHATFYDPTRSYDTQCPKFTRCNNQTNISQSYDQIRFCDRPIQQSSFNDINSINQTNICDTRSYDQTRFYEEPVEPTKSAHRVKFQESKSSSHYDRNRFRDTNHSRSCHNTVFSPINYTRNTRSFHHNSYHNNTKHTSNNDQTRFFDSHTKSSINTGFLNNNTRNTLHNTSDTKHTSNNDQNRFCDTNHTRSYNKTGFSPNNHTRNTLHHNSYQHTRQTTFCDKTCDTTNQFRNTSFFYDGPLENFWSNDNNILIEKKEFIDRLWLMAPAQDYTLLKYQSVMRKNCHCCEYSAEGVIAIKKCP